MQGLRCVSPNYMTQQDDINEKMRAILIDWLIEVNWFFSTRPNNALNGNLGFIYFVKAINV